MRSNEKKVFYFHADANSLGGSLEEPFQEIVPSQASVSLPAAGGYATARTDAFGFREIVSCRSAYTRVSGRTVEKNGPWSTLVTSVVEGLNILEIVTADRIVAQISVEHPGEGEFSRISFAGSQFEKLRIGGQDVRTVLNPNLLAIGAGADNTQAKAMRPALLNVGQKQAREIVQAITESADRDDYEWALQRYGWMEPKRERKDGSALCSLVDGVEGDLPGKSIGHFVEIPDFGRIFLGELMVLHHSIQLTMVRAELGCNVKGKISAGSGRANGSTMPPW